MARHTNRSGMMVGAGEPRMQGCYGVKAEFSQESGGIRFGLLPLRPLPRAAPGTYATLIGAGNRS
jgi:hypothetical protein